MPPLPISLCADRSGFTLSAACCKMHVGAYIAHLRQLWKQRFPSTSPLRTAERRVDHSSARYWHINVLSVALCDLAEFQKPFPESSSRNWVFPVERRAPLWATRDFLSLLIVFFWLSTSSVWQQPCSFNLQNQMMWTNLPKTERKIYKTSKLIHTSHHQMAIVATQPIHPQDSRNQYTDLKSLM